MEKWLSLFGKKSLVLHRNNSRLQLQRLKTETLVLLRGKMQNGGVIKIITLKLLPTWSYVELRICMIDH